MQYKILAVDDNPINLKLLSRALVNSSYQILTAGSGQEALDLAFAEKPDLILLDVMMPDMDGYAVCKKMQEHEDTSYIPVIFLSAKNESIDKARGLALGAVDYLTKPFDALEINARVRTHLTAHQATIKAIHKKLELQQENKDLSVRLSEAEDKLETLQYLTKIGRSGFHLDTDTYQLLSMVKSQQQPETGVLVPVLKENNQLLLLIFNGFEKNYSTLVILLMLEKYIEGFIQAHKDELLSDETMQQLVSNLLERFSPDIFEVAFTFSLALIHPGAEQLLVYSVHQTLPFLINPGGNSASVSGDELPFVSDYSEIIKAMKVKFPKGSILCYYRNGVNPFNESVYEDVFLKAFSENDFQLQKSIFTIDKNLPDVKTDQVIAALQLK